MKKPMMRPPLKRWWAKERLNSVTTDLLAMRKGTPVTTQPIKLTMPENWKGFLPPYPVSEMTVPESMMFVQLMMFAKDGVPEDMKAAALKNFGVAVAAKRLEAYGIEYDLLTLLWLIARARNPAHSVTIAYTMALMTKELGRKVTLEDASMHFFPDGLPIMEGDAFRKLWDSQKLTDEQRRAHPHIMDNLIDVCEWPK